MHVEAHARTPVTGMPGSTTAALLLLAFAAAGCSSGSGGSDVGVGEGVAPTARVQILNGGENGTFREGAEVLLTGKASEDGDGPLIDWTWRQTAGAGVRLIEANSTTVSFTAPAVDAPTTLTFELTVEDSTGDTARAPAEVTVVPARDSDKFLSLDIATDPIFDSFKIVTALAGGAGTGNAPKPFTLSVQAFAAYPPRTAPDADCGFDPAEFAGGVPAVLASGCRVQWLEDLTPQPLALGGTGLTGEWPAGIDAPNEPEAARIARWWNPRFSVKIPRLDVREFNQQFVDADRRDLMLDGFAAHKARIVLDLKLSAPENQQDATMILTDLGNEIVDLPAQISAQGALTSSKVIENDGAGLPTSALVPQEVLLASVAGREAALTAEVYYRTVDPDGTRTTLNDWLLQAGFAADDTGRLLDEAVAGQAEFARAVYVNNFDLGFGRQMYTRTDELGNVFSFVKNYSTLEGAIRSLDSFVTVVMEYSPLLGHADPTPKFVKFFTYVEDGAGDAPRVASFDFDGRGERSTPGNCTSCHGGMKPPGVAELVFDDACGDPTDHVCYTWPATNRDGQSIENGDLAGTFLPWDLGSLLFADTDPAIVAAPVPFDGVTLGAELVRDYGDFSRAGQESQFKKLNQAAYETYDTPRTDAVRRLVELWYGGADQTGKLIGAAFDDSTVASGWRDGELVPDPSPAAGGALIMNPDGAETLYRDVYAQHCRMCHTSLVNDALQFDTYHEFIAMEDAIRRTVFELGVMPAARLTMDRFWSPFVAAVPPGDLLAAHLGNVSGEAPPAPPGAAIASIAGVDPAPHRGDTVYLDGRSSAFAGSYSWALAPPAGSAATLVGAATPHPTFVVDVPGTYDVTLVVNGKTESEAASTVSAPVANRAPAAASDLFALDLLESTQLSGSVLSGANPDADPDGDPLAAAAVATDLPAFGSVVVNSDGSFTYTFTAGAIPAAGSDRFGYEIADGFGGTDRASATILLNGVADQDRPTAPAIASAADASTAAGSGSVFEARLSWLASSGTVTGYNVYRDGALLALVPSAAPPGAVVTYADQNVAPDTTYVYNVTAVNGNGESEPSQAHAVEIATSLRQNVQTGWGSGTDSLWQDSGCIGCHRGAAGGLTLRGTADEVFAELTEDAGAAAPIRLEREVPLTSLLLCKPLIDTHPDGCAHEGGNFYAPADPRYRTLLRWIADGAPDN